MPRTKDFNWATVMVGSSTLSERLVRWVDSNSWSPPPMMGETLFLWLAAYSHLLA